MYSEEPAMPTASGYAEVSVRMSNTALVRPAYVVFGVDPTDTDPLTIAANVISALTGAGTFQGLLDSNVTINRVRVSLGTDGAEDIIGDVAVSIPGLVGGSSVAANTALLLHKRTARGGRRGRGRMYVPWALPTTNVDEGGTVLAASIAGLQSKASAFLTALNTNTVPMVVLHDPGITAPGPPNLVTTLLVDNRVGTQRRRLGR